MKFEELKSMTLQELRELAKNMGYKNITKYRKSELIEELLKERTEIESEKEDIIEIPEDTEEIDCD